MGQAEVLSYCRQDDARNDWQMAVCEEIERQCLGFRRRLRFVGGFFLAVMEVDPPHETGA
ncbi:hypothetical protein D3C72_2467010 [compost metagenome]